MGDQRPVRRLFTEGLLIVASILLAFFIDRSYEGFRDRGEERIVLEGLRSDFAANREALGTYVTRYGSVHRNAIRLVDLLAGDRRSVPRDSLVMAMSLSGAGSFDPRSATLSQIESAGRADLIRDPELRALISQWTKEREDAADTQAQMDSWNQNHVWPVLSDLGVGPVGEDRAGIGRPRDLVVTRRSEGSTPGPTLDQMRGSGLEARVRFYAFLVQVNRGDLVDVLDATNAVLARLDVLLER